MKLFTEEEILTTTQDNIVILTTHRIRCNNSLYWGQRSTTSIMLENISSIHATYISYPILLVISGIILLFMVGISANTHDRSELVVIPAIVIGILVILYFATRKNVCIIASNGGSKIIFQTNNLSHDSLLDFIDKVEQAKQKKLLTIFR